MLDYIRYCDIIPNPNPKSKVDIFGAGELLSEENTKALRKGAAKILGTRERDVPTLFMLVVVASFILLCGRFLVKSRAWHVKNV